MPLNINKPYQPPIDESSSPDPILHQPKEDDHAAKRVVMVIFILAVLGAVTFLVYVFTSITKQSQPPAETSAVHSAETTVVGRGAPMALPSESGASHVTSQAHPYKVGDYTIFIASHTDRSAAEEEVARWREAGYTAYVIEANGHFRVALGQYTTLSDARKTVAELEDAFENGYWIGRLE